MGRIPVGLQLYTVRQEYAEDPVATIKAVAKMGYEGVEGGPPAGMSNKEFLDLLADNGMKLVGGGTGIGEMMDNLPTLVDKCTELGINTLMTGLGGDLRKHDNDWKATVAELGEACTKASAAGLRILYHNHAFEFEAKVDGMYGLDYIYATIPKKHIQAEIDVYWVKTGGEDPVKYINKYAGMVPFLHIKDRTPPPDDEKNPFAEIGQGILEWDGIFAAAEKAGVEWYLVEQDRWNRPPMESAKMSIDYLKARGMV